MLERSSLSAASRTALLVAGYRARATRAVPQLVNDPWAAHLAGDAGEQASRDFDRAQPHMELWIAVRTAHLDARVRHLTGPACAVPSVVVLGAGLDTRAARLAHAGVRFFEVDHPATQTDKRARLSAIAGYPMDAASFVACDFERDDFVERLEAAGLDRGAPAVFVWEGVTPYLTERAVRATLGRIATGCHPRSVVLFDFLGRKIVEGRASPEDLEARDHVADLGEPLRWGTNDVVPLVHECGMRRITVRSFDEIGVDLTGTYDRERKWRFQYLAETSVSAPELP